AGLVSLDLIRHEGGVLQSPPLNPLRTHMKLAPLSPHGHVEHGVAHRAWSFPVRSAEERQRLRSHVEKAPAHRRVRVFPVAVTEADATAALHGRIFSPAGHGEVFRAVVMSGPRIAPMAGNRR